MRNHFFGRNLAVVYPIFSLALYQMSKVRWKYTKSVWPGWPWRGRWRSWRWTRPGWRARGGSCGAVGAGRGRPRPWWNLRRPRTASPVPSAGSWRRTAPPTPAPTASVKPPSGTRWTPNLDLRIFLFKMIFKQYPFWWVCNRWGSDVARLASSWFCVTWFRDLLDRDALLLGHETQHAEDGEARVEAGAAVGGRDENAIAYEIVVELVVRAERRHAAQRDGVREEYLRSSVNPHLHQHKIHRNN